jgi:Ca-activated chloride channel homolog
VLHYLLWRWAIAFLILALMNPRFGKKEVEVRYSGIDLMICLDVSNSMLAEDISPNRLLRARRAISQLLDKLHGDRIGLIVFAGDAYVQLPITTDYEAAEMFLSSVSADMVPTQGTAIGKAIYLALNSFGTDNTGSRSIIVITDGENHEDDAVTAATQAYEQGVIVHTIGMGSVEGAPLPIYDRGIKRGFKKDKEGNTVMSKLNEDMLTQVGSAGGGIFVRATNADVGLDLIVDEIEAMTENEFGTEKYADHEDRFQIFLLAGLVMLCLDVLLSYHKRKMLGIEL